MEEEEGVATTVTDCRMRNGGPRVVLDGAKGRHNVESAVAPRANKTQ